MSAILIKDIKEIITMDDERRRLRGYSLLIKDNKIARIARGIEPGAGCLTDTDGADGPAGADGAGGTHNAKNNHSTHCNHSTHSTHNKNANIYSTDITDSTNGINGTNGTNGINSTNSTNSADIADSINSYQDVEVIDGRDCFLFPGLINTHHHFYQSLTRNLPRAQPLELFDWLKYLYPLWARLTPEAVYYSTLVAAGELLKTGCTTAVDHFYVFPSGQPRELLDEEFRAAAEIGIRFHGCRGSMSLGEKDGGLPPEGVVQSEEEILSDSLRVIEKYHDQDPLAMQRVVLAPCSPFSVSRRLLRESVELAREYGVESHTHLAETKDEEEYCLTRYKKRPLEYMEELGWLGNDIWYAHGVHLIEEEIEKMAASGTGVAHCPVSNQKLASGAAPVPAMLKAGVPVGLAVDGSASNDASNMILELKAAFLLHRLTHGVESISAEDVLSLATLGGSRILNRPELGRIEEGKAADMFLMDSRRLGLAGGLHDPVAALINTGCSQLVDLTIVNGRVVVRGGRLLTVDEERIIAGANRLSREMVGGEI